MRIRPSIFAASGPVAGLTVHFEFDYGVSSLLTFKAFSSPVEIIAELVNQIL